jgi:hypothetical protein
MISRRYCRAGVGLGAAFLVACLRLAQASPVLAADEDPGSLAQYYGFRSVEMTKLNPRSEGMIAGDFNNDGKTDLLLIDNSTSRLDLLEQRVGPPKDDAPRSRDVNAIRLNSRFEHKKLALDRAVVTLAAGDMNGDGLLDIVYFAAPDQLTIRYQTPNGDWTKRERIRLTDVPPTRWNTAVGDLNGDGRDDVVVLGKVETFVVYQKAGGELSAPASLMNTTENIGLAQIADLDGDGRNDLCYIASDDADRPLCGRLQGADGRLGPEMRFEMPRFRGITFADLDGRPGAEFIAVEATTNRIKAYQFQRPTVEAGELAGQLIQYGFGRESLGANRDIAIGDVNADGLNDVVVCDPEGAQMIVFQQGVGSGLDQGTTFPGLMGAQTVRIADLDGDKTAEIVVMSLKEKAIAVSRMESGRLSFPQPVAIDREPSAMDVADLNGDGKAEIIFLGRERTASSSTFTLQAVSSPGKDSYQPVTFGAEAAVKLNLKTPPDRLVALDANHDGTFDFLVFAGADRPPVFLLGKPDGSVSEVTGDRGVGLSTLAPSGLCLGRLDQPAILVAQSNFARHVEVGPNSSWRVVDQFNAPGSDARIVGVATLDLDLQAGREIVLVDSGGRKLRVLKKEGSVYRPWREVEIGAFAFKGAYTADLNGDGRDDLLLFGPGKFGVLYAGQTDPRLKSVATYETKLEKSFFSDVVAGDINNDGRTDVVSLDTQTQMVDILDFSPSAGFRHGLFFKVFEAKSLQSEERTGVDPREGVIADVTGDGLPDLVLLSQDRVLVFPQDNGIDEATASN